MTDITSMSDEFGNQLVHPVVAVNIWTGQRSILCLSDDYTRIVAVYEGDDDKIEAAIALLREQFTPDHGTQTH
jgi:hypothetical protein